MASQKNVRTAHSLPERKRTSDVLSSENINVDFASLLLSEPVQKGLTAAGFEKPSPIQLKAIPLGRCGLDLIVQAKSGTGKTCVFSVIALESIITTSSSLQVLVLAPTREIAVQIQNVIQAIGVAMEGLKCHTFIGGTIFGQDRQHLKKCHIAVGTPGRIKQLIEYEVLKTESIRMFVLDEADKLLDEKFQASVNWIYHQLPENKQMLALSATYPESLAQQLTNYMRDPTFVRLNPRDLTLQGIKQFYKVVPGHQLPHKSFQIKADHLVTLLSQIAFNQCLIFSNFQSRAHNLCELLLEKGWPATYISGNQEQVDRMKAMTELKTYKCRILISTDLTSRGIDAENVNLIINLDVPVDFKTYLHRIGRAGRFGTHGAAITLASEGQEVNLLKTVKKRSGSDIRLLPDPVPSYLLEMSVAKVQAEILDPLDVSEPAEMEIVEDQDTSQSQRKENSDQMLELEDSTKEQICYPQMEKDGDVDGEVNGNMAVNGYPPVEKVYHVSPEKQTQVSFGNKNGASTSETKHYESEEKLLEGKVRRDLQNGIGRMVEAGGDQFQIRRSSSHRWMVNLDEWVLPIMVMQEVRKTTRKRWTWEEAFREFENKRQSYKNEKVTLDSEEGNSQLQNGDAPFRDDSFEVGSKEDGVKGLGASDGTKKGSQRDTFSKTDDNSDHGDELNVAGTEKMLEKSDVYVEFQAMRALLKQCKTEMVALKGVDLIPRLARQVRLRNDKVKSQKEMVLETKGPNAGYKNLPRGRTKGGDFEKQEVSMDFKLEEEEAQIERPKAGGEGRIVGRQSERTSGIDDKISGVIGETSGVYDVSRVGRTFGTVDDEQMSKSNAYPQENRLDGQDSCEMELNLNERKLKNSPEESQTNPTGELCYDEHFKRNRPSVKFEQIGDGETIGATKDSDWTHGAGCHSNLSKENTSDKIWEYFKQYLKEESKTSLPSQRLGKMNEEINDSESVNHCRSDSDGLSSLSKSERSVESEQRLLDYKTSDLSTGSLKLNDFDSFKKSDGEKKLPRKGKTRKNSKGQDVSLDASYGYYPSHGGWEWNEGALGDGSYEDGWDSYVYPSNNLWWEHGETGWSHGYEESIYPHSYWGSYYYNY